MTGIPPLALGRARRSKYGNVRCELDGINFDSKAEARYYAGNLKIRQMAGEIDGLFVHPVYPLKVNDLHIAKYEADFTYRDVKTGKTHVIDVKGGRNGKAATNTDLSKMKQRLLLALYGIEVEIVVCG